jgi:PST family polysaccharide transporter
LERNHLSARIGDALRKRPGLRRVLSNTVWMYADRILRMTVGLLVGVWLARYLGPHAYGQFSYAVALVALFGALSTLGLDRVLVRDLVGASTARHELLGSALVLRLLGSAVAMSAAVLCVRALRPDDVTTQQLVVVVAAGMFVQALDILEFWFESRLESRYTVVAKGAAFLAATAAKIALILIGATVIAFAWSSLLEVVLAAVGLVVAYRISGERFARWRASVSCALALLKPALPLVFAGIAVSTYMKIDQIMLGEMLGDEAVGAYSAAVHLCEATYFVPGVLVASLFPVIVSSRASNKQLFLARMQRLFDLMVVFGIGLALPLSLLSPYIIQILYGDAFSAASGVLAIYAWAAIFVFLGVASSSYLLVENLTIVSLYRTTLGAVTNVGLNLLLIPRFGITGAAYATLISYGVAAYGVFLDRRARVAGVMMLRALVPFRLIGSGKGR